MVESYFTAEAARPSGHYSQAVGYGDFVFVSGQLPVDPASGVINHGEIEEQARLVFQNLEAILQASDSELNSVLKVTIYIADKRLWRQVNEIYAEFFGEHKPARTVVPGLDLHYGCLIEADVIAVKKKAKPESAKKLELEVIDSEKGKFYNI